MKRSARFADFFLSLVLTLAIVGCSLAKNDPVGTALLSMKVAYESTVHTAGRAYLAKVLTEDQLRNFRDKANVFYDAYTSAVLANDLGRMSANDPRMARLSELLDSLQKLVNDILNAKGV